MLGSIIAREFELAHPAIPATGLTLLQSVGGGIGVVSCGSPQNGAIQFTSLTVEVENAGDTNALLDFQIEGKVHQDGTWVVLKTGTAWATAAAPLTYKTANVNTLAKSSAAVVKLDVGPFYQLRFSAKAAAGTTAVNVRGRLFR